MVKICLETNGYIAERFRRILKTSVMEFETFNIFVIILYYLYSISQSRKM